MRVQSLKHVAEIPEVERTPLVTELIELCHLQAERIQALEDEIARLKGNKPAPRRNPSGLADERESEGKRVEGDGKRAGSVKRHKTAELTIHETKVVPLDDRPPGSRFRGYEEFTVQDLRIEPHNTCYRRERWERPEGGSVVAPMPAGVACGHFGVTLVCFVLYQYNHARVTQPLILEQLLEWGIDISAGQINVILTEEKWRWHEEKAEILRVGLQVSRSIHVDDTGARHQGKSGHCTHIGNEQFAWFESTESKSRINFLMLLRGTNTEYVIDDDALAYMRAQKLPKYLLARLQDESPKVVCDEAAWKQALEAWGIEAEHHIRTVTEGALVASILRPGCLHPDLVIMSDDAGQFHVFTHTLCWWHAERIIQKLVGFSAEQRAALEGVRDQIWELYQDLKRYKDAPSEQKAAELEARFDALVSTKTCFATLNQALQRMASHKAELLLVLKRPDLPLNNNESERSLREYVTKRKVSGSTRSDEGRRCRDTFASFKKTCRKLGISFWSFLLDRVTGGKEVPWLPDLIRQRASAANSS